MSLEDRLLDVLQQTYPGWRITIRAGRWWATKRNPVSDEQKQLGIHAMIGRENGPDLAAALNKQVMTLHQHRIR